MRVCPCGALEGYAHADDCPYPLFERGESQMAAWEAERHEKQYQLIVADLVDAACEASELFGDDELERFAQEYAERGGAG